MVSFLSFSGPRMICPCYRRMTAAHENICVFCESVFLLCVYSKCLWSDSEQRCNSAEVCRSCELTAGVCCEIHERFGFYTAAQNNRPPIGWENRSRWITPSQLDSDTSWPVKRCFLLIEGAGERERLQPPAAFLDLAVVEQTRSFFCSRWTWKHCYWRFMFQEYLKAIFCLCYLLNQVSLCSY